MGRAQRAAFAGGTLQKERQDYLKPVIPPLAVGPSIQRLF